MFWKAGRMSCGSGTARLLSLVAVTSYLPDCSRGKRCIAHGGEMLATDNSRDHVQHCLLVTPKVLLSSEAGTQRHDSHCRDREPSRHPRMEGVRTVYTRKSSEEGLEQDFNSLDAQREACEAYIKSQKHEGWVVLPAHYDDGGFSGGTHGAPGAAAAAR